jgi:hypothetical protein
LIRCKMRRIDSPLVKPSFGSFMGERGLGFLHLCDGEDEREREREKIIIKKKIKVKVKVKK